MATKQKTKARKRSRVRTFFEMLADRDRFEKERLVTNINRLIDGAAVIR